MKRAIHLFFCFLLSAPFLAAQPCDITDAGFISASCVGTNIIEFTINPVGTGLSNSYLLSSTQGYNISPFFGQYGVPETFTLATIGAPPADLEITLLDQGNSSCTLTFSFPNPCVSSSACNITDPGLTFSCNGNGIVLFSLNPVATGNGTSYSVSSSQGFLSSSFGQYGQTTSFLLQFSGPPPATVEITITDVDDPNCTLTFTFPNPCITTPCDIFGASPLDVECNDNGTPNDPSDDFITFVLDPSGTGLGSGYEVTTSIGPVTPPTGTYGGETTFQTQPGTAGNGNFQITITDLDDNTCTFSIGVIDPGVCSTPAPCEVQLNTLTAPVCDDNGTPSDPSDDTFTFDLSATGVNASNGWTANDPNATSGNYGELVTFGPYPISGGGFTFQLIDNNDPNCISIDIVINPPAPCSNTPTCLIQSFFVLSVVCNDNGTPSDPSDDFYDIVLDPTGSGLGMYIVKQCVDRLKGKITVDSIYGKGTTIHLTLPRYYSKPE
jgi:hypothetical protein